jgi:hypothetical protein
MLGVLQSRLSECPETVKTFYPPTVSSTLTFHTAIETKVVAERNSALNVQGPSWAIRRLSGVDLEEGVLLPPIDLCATLHKCGHVLTMHRGCGSLKPPATTISNRLCATLAAVTFG